MTGFSFTAADFLYLLTLSFGIAFNFCFFMGQYLESRVKAGAAMLISMAYSAVAALLFPHIPVTVRSFSAPLGTLLLAFLIYKGPALRKIGTVAVYQVCILFLDAIITASVKLAGIPIESYTGSRLFMWVNNVVVVNLTLIPVALLLRPWLRPKEKRPAVYAKETVGLLASLFVSVTIMMDFAFALFSEEKIKTLAFICTAAAMLVSAVLLLLWTLKKIDAFETAEQKKILAEKECEFAEERRRQAGRYKAEVENLEKEISSQLGRLAEWIECGKTEEALCELERSVAETQKVPRPRVQPDPLLDYILSGLQKRCDGAAVCLKTKVGLSSFKGVTDVDFCTVLTNVVDNAVRAVCDAKCKNRFINLDIHRNGDILFIGCENSKTAFGEKAGKRQFGHFGLVNIKKTVGKYGGDVQIEDCQETFRIQILLYCVKLPEFS